MPLKTLFRNNNILQYRAKDHQIDAYLYDQNGYISEAIMSVAGANFYAKRFPALEESPLDVSIRYSSKDITKGKFTFDIQAWETDISVGDYVYEITMDTDIAGQQYSITVAQDIFRVVDSLTPHFTFLDASGGTITYDGDFKIHTFDSSGTYEFIVYYGGLADILIVGAGGGGNYRVSNSIVGAQAGGGGYVYYANNLYLDSSTYEIIVGAGEQNTDGSKSSFFGIDASGGLMGGNTYGGTSGSGYAGGLRALYGHGGGGGGHTSIGVAANGGAGYSSNISGEALGYGGGGGGGYKGIGIDGGGDGSKEGHQEGYDGVRGGGGGGGANGGTYGNITAPPGKGGDGIVIIRYRYLK